LGTVLALAFVITLVPGILVAVVLRLVGVPLGPTLLFGLLAVFVGMGYYPRLLRRLGGDDQR
jgi:xanthosine utilization system XapX-like protein